MFSHSSDQKNEKMVFTSNDYYINDRDKKFDVINSQNIHTTHITQNSEEGNPLRQMDYNKTHEGNFNFNINSNTDSNFYKSYKHPGNSSLNLPENSETSKTYDTTKKYSYQDSYQYPTDINENNISKYTKYANDPFRNNSDKSSNVNKSNQSFNYNSELKYYRDVVDKMHDEINNLNTKLNELDKNNSLSFSNVEAPYKKVVNNQTRDFVRDIPETTNGYYGLNEKSSYDNCYRNASNDYLNNLRLNYNYTTESLTNDTELNSPTYYSSESVKANQENEGVIPINTKANFPNNKKHKVNKGDKQTNSASSTTPIRNKSKTNTNSDNTVSRVNKFNTNSNPNTNKPRPDTKESKSSVSKKENNSKILKQTQKARSVSNIKKSKTLNSKNTKVGINIPAVLKDNENLKNQVKFLEKKLNDINEQTKLDQIERKGKDYLRIELEIWKNKTDLLSKNYIQTLSSMKKQILDDKNMFVEKIKSMEDEYSDEIVSLKNKYQNLLERQELNLKLYKKENDNLKKKLSKVKEILI